MDSEERFYQQFFCTFLAFYAFSVFCLNGNIIEISKVYKDYIKAYLVWQQVWLYQWYLFIDIDIIDNESLYKSWCFMPNLHLHNQCIYELFSKSFFILFNYIRRINSLYEVYFTCMLSKWRILPFSIQFLIMYNYL
jgi:hypothetical protein